MLPRSFLASASRESHKTVSMSFIIDEAASVDSSVSESVDALALSLFINPLPCVNSTTQPFVGPLSIDLIVREASFVCGAVCVSQRSFTAPLIVSPTSCIHISIDVSQSASAMLHVILVFTFVLGAADPFLASRAMSFTIKFGSFVYTTIVVEGSSLTLP